MDFGPNIRRLREEHGLTQAELAELIGEHKTYVSEWENGREPKLSKAKKLAAALGVSLDELAAEPAGVDD